MPLSDITGILGRGLPVGLDIYRGYTCSDAGVSSLFRARRIQSTHPTPFFEVQFLNSNIFGGFQKVIIWVGDMNF